MQSKLKIGVSSCLLGAEVRFNGGHCRNHFINDQLSEYADFTSVCPETGIGMGIPRESVRLEFDQDRNISMRAPKSGQVYTDEMATFSKNWVEEASSLDLDGFILKKNSPSCGVFRVKIYANDQPSERRGTGMFAHELMKRFPELPVEEDGRLSDPLLRENFVERVFAYRRIKDLFSADWTNGEIIRFHSQEKLLLMAHSPKHYKQLGRLVADIKVTGRTEFKETYIKTFMAAMSEKPSRGRHTNALSHMAGYLKRKLTADGRKELYDTIKDYRAGTVPLIVPITLINHMLRRFNEKYLLDQTYLSPHPKQMALRNHA